LNALRAINGNIATEMPRTTSELLAMVAEVDKALDGGARKDETDQAVFVPKDTRYENGTLNNWWAQYEGITGYNNYWNGVDAKGDPSVEIFSQQGRLESLTVLDGLLSEYGYGGDSNDVGRFQNRFMMGWGVFMLNGDWFLNEVKANYSSKLNNIEFMNVPVISEIGVKLFGEGTSYGFNEETCDEVLSFICKLVDEGKPLTEIIAGVKTQFGFDINEADAQAVATARGLTFARGIEHLAFIPKGCAKKDIAALALFLCSDQAGFITGENICIDGGQTRLMIYHGEHGWTYRP
jgi:hypothetical protein